MHAHGDQVALHGVGRDGCIVGSLDSLYNLRASGRTAAEALATEERAAKELAKEQAAADAAAAEAKQAILDGGAKQKVIEGGPNELEEMWEKEEL
mgnify:CR=1 FL=1